MVYKLQNFKQQNGLYQKCLELKDMLIVLLI